MKALFLALALGVTLALSTAEAADAAPVRAQMMYTVGHLNGES